MLTSLIAGAALAVSAILPAHNGPAPVSSCTPIPGASFCLEASHGIAEPSLHMTTTGGSSAGGQLFLTNGIQFIVEGVGCSGSNGLYCTWNNMQMRLTKPVCALLVTPDRYYGPVCLPAERG